MDSQPLILNHGCTIELPEEGSFETCKNDSVKISETSSDGLLCKQNTIPCSRTAFGGKWVSWAWKTLQASTGV